MGANGTGAALTPTCAAIRCKVLACGIEHLTNTILSRALLEETIGRHTTDSTIA
jgi:hypothetical protein